MSRRVSRTVHWVSQWSRLQPRACLPRSLWQHSFLKRRAVLLKGGLRAGACPHRHAETSCLLSSVITRLTTGPSTVTASTLNWPVWPIDTSLCRLIVTQPLKAQMLCVWYHLPWPCACQRETCGSRLPSLLTSLKAKSPLKPELYNLPLQNSQRIIWVSERLCF